MSVELASLDANEARQLAECEAVIERGVTTFLEVGSALLSIRENRLYRAAFATFDAYCESRWGFSDRRARQLIDAAEAVAAIVESGTTVPKPKNEAQARPLKQLPKRDRAEAWGEAVAESNGKPTAAKVKEVVDRKIGKPPKAQAAPKPDPNGKTKLNGVHVEDPPHIAKQRAAGKIGPDVVVEIDEPEPAPVEQTPDVEPAPVEQTDEEWLADLPLSGKLDGGTLKTFQADALVYRSLEAHRKTFAHHATRSINRQRRKGAYVWQVRRFLGINHPNKWTRCPEAPEGCGGSGTSPFGDCPKCFGRGYLILGTSNNGG